MLSGELTCWQRSMLEHSYLMKFNAICYGEAGRLSKYCCSSSMLFLYIAIQATFATNLFFFADHLISLSNVYNHNCFLLRIL